MKRRRRRASLLLVAVIAAVPGGTTAAQRPPPTDKVMFEVASVRPSAPGTRGGVSRPVGGLVRATGASLRDLILFAFDLMPVQRHDPEPVGGPAWTDRDRFDVVAKGAADLSLADARLMMRSLLEDRFKLHIRTETREVPAYALRLARQDGKLGSGLRPSSMDCTAYSATLASTGRIAAAKEVGPNCGLTTGGARGVASGLGIQADSAPGALMSHGSGMLDDLIGAISRSPDVDRRIVDRTGLSGTFDVHLTWAPTRGSAGAGSPADTLSVFTAVQDQLGLKLEAIRVPAGVIVIDSAEQPTFD